MKERVKHFLMLLVCSLLLCGTLSIVLFAEEPVEVMDQGKCGKNVTWILYETGEMVVSGTGAMSNYDKTTTPWSEYQFEINSVVIGDGVTHVGNKTFFECYCLENVVLPDSITTIGEYAFSSTSLNSVKIPDDVISIGKYAFESSGIKSLNIPKGIKKINDGVFSGCCMSKVVIPKGVTSIGTEAFAYCEYLKEINIPDTVVSIGDDAFYGSIIKKIELPSTLSYLGKRAFAYCEYIENVTIPKTVKELSYNSFLGCKKLKGVWINKDNPYFCNDKYGVVFNKKKTKLIMAPCTITSYVVPESVTSIGDGAFNRCEKLKTITMKEGIKNIGDSAFSNCKSLKKIDIPNGVKTISEYAFYFCENLSEINLPNTITSIEVRAFSNCNSISEMTFPKKLKSIGNFAFMENYNLEKVIFTGDALEKITSSAFGGDSVKAYYPENNKTWTTKKLKLYPEEINWIKYAIEGATFTNKSLNAKFKVTAVMNTVAYAGSTNKNATVITIPKTVKRNGITYKVTSISKAAFKDNKKLKTATIGNNVKTIGASAFKNCSSLKTVKMGDKVTTIGREAFYGCKKLETLTIGVNTKLIGVGAFQNCTSLKYLTIPKQVEKIGEKAFYGDKNIRTLTIKTTKLTTKNVGKQAFTKVGSSNYKKVVVKVPKSKLTVYKNSLRNKGLSKDISVKKIA